MRTPESRRRHLHHALFSSNHRQEYIEPLKESVDTYFSSMSEGDFKTYVDMVYPKVFLEDSLKEQTIAMMQDYADRGLRNVTTGHELIYASPLIQDSLQKVTRLVLKVKHEVLFSSDYPGDPKDMENMIKNQFGADVYSYNEVERKYQIDAQVKLYAITPDSAIHFTFLNDQYSQSRYLSEMLLYNTIFELKKLDEKNGY